jgi:hypothetical protein
VSSPLDQRFAVGETPSQGGVGQFVLLERIGPQHSCLLQRLLQRTQPLVRGGDLCSERRDHGEEFIDAVRRVEPGALPFSLSMHPHRRCLRS